MNGGAWKRATDGCSLILTENTNRKSKIESNLFKYWWFQLWNVSLNCAEVRTHHSRYLPTCTHSLSNSAAQTFAVQLSVVWTHGVQASKLYVRFHCQMLLEYGIYIRSRALTRSTWIELNFFHYIDSSTPFHGSLSHAPSPRAMQIHRNPQSVHGCWLQTDARVCESVSEFYYYFSSLSLSLLSVQSLPCSLCFVCSNKTLITTSKSYAIKKIWSFERTPNSK